MIGRSILVAGLLIGITLTTFGQATTRSQPGAGTRRNFTLYGDLKIVDQGEGQKPQTFDVILYTRGGDVFGRQRISNGGRYRFNNIFNGDYYLAIELENVELARMPVMISGTYADDIRQDITLQSRSVAGRTGGPAGTVSVANLYDRTSQNRTLYQKSAKEIESKNFTAAIATLRELVASDPKDYPAWTDLGMVYFIQKDLDGAEKSYTGALTAKPDHFPALLSLGRVYLAEKKFDKAIESLEAALKVDPKSASANFFLGEAYLQVKKGSKAVVYLTEALNLDPIGMADAHLRLGALYNLAGYKDRAANEYEQFLKKKPDYPERKKLEDYIQANKPKQ